MKNESTILKDIAKVYLYLESKNKETNKLYETLSLQDRPKIFQSLINMPKNKETALALIDRVVGLKEAPLENVLKKMDFSYNEILKAKEKMLEITEEYYMQRHKDLLDFVQKENLLTEFLRELLKSVHKIGLVFNTFFKNWQKDLILGINKDLQSKFHNDLNAILEALKESFEVSSSGEMSDRSYSVPQYDGEKYKAVAYASFFKKDFLAFRAVFDEVLEKLESIPEVCAKLEQKSAYLEYFKALKNALLQENVKELLESWREVDRKWMQISTPLQVGHPLEYYEDHYRKSVAPEWDVRIARIYEGKDLLEEDKGDFKISKNDILEFYKAQSANLPMTKYKDSIDKSVEDSLLKTQSYGGMPLMFYGAELNGLFSAQVVPNDESVSQKYGKKIFYFPDRVWNQSASKPFMKLSSKTFPKSFLDFNRALLYFQKEQWYRVYEISTVGHEFGHILWVDNESELVMNKSGEFKNIEEFKATMGGLAYYFSAKNQSLQKELIFNTISRAVSLMAWKKESEVLPYYCEGLIHLDIMFASGVLQYAGDFSDAALEICEEKFQSLQELYLKTYKKLATIYLEKKDAKEFLSDYVIKEKNGEYMPKNKKVYDFVKDYYREYENNGQVLDEISIETWKENYKNEQYVLCDNK